jgi:kynureninase
MAVQDVPPVVLFMNGTRAWELPRFAGWWGHDEESRFEMGPKFQPMPGADGWQLSNPSIVSLAVLRASMDIFHEAGMEQLRAKSVVLTGYLEFLLSQNASRELLHHHTS